MKDVIIVGGGLTGMLTARSLHDAGMSVMLIDQGELGHESSWVSGGVIAPLTPGKQSAIATQLTQFSQQHYPALCDALYTETRIDPQLITSGLLVLDSGQDNPMIPTMADAQKGDEQRPAALKTLTEIHPMEPGLNPAIEKAWHFPTVQQVRNPSLVQAMAASLRKRPLLISEHQPVTGLKIRKNRVLGVKMSGQTFKAHKVIITTGAWSGCFPELQDITPGLTLLQEEMILFRGKPGLLRHIVAQDQHYLIPRRDGRIICGAVQTPSTHDSGPQTTKEAFATLRSFATSLLPALQDFPIRNHWAGLHAQTTDDIPCVGKHPGIKGLYLNIGHGANGMVTGLASVQILVDRVLKQTNALGMNSCHSDT